MAYSTLFYRNHPVTDEIVRRIQGADTNARLGLLIEGGALRTIVPAATAAQLQSLCNRFDVVGGVSAGAITSLFYMTRRVRFYRFLFRGDWLGQFVHPWQLLRLQPMINTKDLLQALDDRIRFSYDPLGDVETITAGAVLNQETLRLNWHEFSPEAQYNDRYRLAACSLPLISGNPIDIGGTTYLDAGYRQPLPFQSFIDRYDLTHLLVLPCQPYHRRSSSLGWFDRLVLMPYLYFFYPRLFELYRERPVRYNRCVGDLMNEAQDSAEPHVLPLYAEGFPAELDTATTDRALLRQAASAGQMAGEMYRSLLRELSDEAV